MPSISEERRQKVAGAILDAALECFSRAGYERTTVDDIARAADRSIGTVYNYFSSKEDLFLELARRELNADLGVIGEHLHAARSFDEALAALFEYVVAQLRDGRGLFPRVSVDFWTHGLRRPELRTEFDANVELLCGAIADELAFGAPEERGEIAYLLVVLTDGLLMHMGHGSGPDIDGLRAIGARLRAGFA
jgi:AcrR family transcriptional regulator